jgi:hypothetical protein
MILKHMSIDYANFMTVVYEIELHKVIFKNLVPTAQIMHNVHNMKTN